jgi:dolichyl-diphosphooligosaccharide--protein glycosyltransferase
VAFWAPAYLAGLSAIVATLWGWLLGGRRPAILAGLLGAISPGFFYRSRLGYFDSDVFTLLMPLTIGFMLAFLLSSCCSRAWRPTDEERQNPAPMPVWMPLVALGFGLVARVAHFAHDDVLLVGVGLFWVAVVVAGVAALPGRRLNALSLLVVYALAASVGERHFGVGVFIPRDFDYLGLGLAVGLALLLWKRPAPLRPVLDHPWVWLGLLLAVAVAGDLLAPLGPVAGKVLGYLKPAVDSAGAGAGGVAGPKYPGITQSIREAKNVADWGALLAGVSCGPWVGALSGLGFLCALALRPALALMLPLFFLSLLSLKMGVRFAMFGGPAFALGLGLGLHWALKLILHNTGANKRLLTLAQIVVSGGCLIFYASAYGKTQPTPVLAPPHGQALMKLKDIAPKGAEVWTWWDFGYATQYYAERMTPIDGGKHAGRDIYPTALVLTTPSFRQAAQVIGLSASLGHDPASRWDTLPAADVKSALESMALVDQPQQKVPPQYLVACWENVNLLHWISYYGSWDLVSGRGVNAKVQVLTEAFNVDANSGVLVFRSGSAPIPVRSVDYLSTQGTRRSQFPINQSGPHLVINDATKQAMLMDDMAYNSMAVQLLIGDPNRPEQSRYFKLAYDGFPYVRIYEILLPAKQEKGQEEAFKQ